TTRARADGAGTGFTRRCSRLPGGRSRTRTWDLVLHLLQGDRSRDVAVEMPELPWSAWTPAAGHGLGLCGAAERVEIWAQPCGGLGGIIERVALEGEHPSDSRAIQRRRSLWQAR